MKIGINASFLRKPGTGIGQVTAHFLRKLAGFQIADFKSQNGELPKFILYCEEVPKLDFELPENFEVKSFLPRWWKRDDVPRKWLWERELAKRAAKDKCDALLSLYQSATDFHAMCLIPHAHTPRHVMVVHDIIPAFFPEYLAKLSQRLHFRAIERAITRADRIVSVSEATKSDLLWHFSVSAKDIAVAYPDAGAQFARIPSEKEVKQVLEKYGLEPGYIYHGGGLEVRKNAEGLLEAYAKLIGKDTRNKAQGTSTFQGSSSKAQVIPPLVISGKIHAKSNKLATDVEGLVKKFGLGEKVKLLGFVPDEDLPALYRGAILFAYPSLYEGFGLPVLEAMRMGTPVLSSDTSSLPEVGGDAVLYCDPKSDASIAAGIERLLGDAPLRETLSRKGMERSGAFSYDAFTRSILKTLL